MLYPNYYQELGQIHRNSQMGEIIFNFASNEKYKTFLEIGTWKGGGSTKCFVDGLINRKDDWTFYSIESDINFYKIALQYYSNILTQYQQHLFLIYGTIIENIEKAIIEYEFDIKSLKKSNQYIKEHDIFLQDDLINYKKCPCILSEIPDYIDIVLLDGGEFTTYIEFKILEHKTHIFILDDSNVLKNQKVKLELSCNPLWQPIINQNSRNGWCIFEKRHITN